jgi:hypothetical protein
VTVREERDFSVLEGIVRRLAERSPVISGYGGPQRHVRRRGIARANAIQFLYGIARFIGIGSPGAGTL